MVYQYLKVICFTFALLLYTYVGEAWARTCSDQEIAIQIGQLSKSGSFEELAVDALSQCDSATIPSLVQKVQQAQNPVVQKGIIAALSKMGGVSTNALIQLLSDQKINQAVREDIITALIQIPQNHSDQAKDISTALLARLSDQREVEQIRVAAVFSMGRGLGSKASFTTSNLISTLKDRRESEEIRYWTAVALTDIDSKNRETVDAIINVLQDQQETWKIRLGMLRVLTKMGIAAKDSIPALIKILQDNTLQKTPEGRNFIDETLSSLVTISEATQAQIESKDIEQFKSNLETTLNTIQEKFERNLIDLTPQIGWESPEFQRSLFIQKQVNSIRHILKRTNTNQATKNSQLSDFLQKHSSLVVPFLTVLGAGFTYLLILRYRARWLVLLPEKIPLSSLKPGLPDVPIPVMRWLKYHPQVLDNWVESRVELARNKFREKETVKDRKIHVSLPIEINGLSSPNEMTSKELKSHFKQPINHLLIIGEGGIGKTSLACQIGEWAMADDVDQRLCQHYMLPVLIEQGFDIEVETGKHPLVVKVQAELRRLVQEPFQLSYELVESLLRRRRLLVIVDHLSEMNDSTRNKFQPGQANFPANALIVTSRLDESLDGVNKTILKPLRIGGNQLLDFAIPYLKEKYPALLFDEQKAGLCRGLSRMIDGRDITVMLAKIYIDQAISSREDVPDTIPGLMLNYVNQLNKSIPQEKRKTAEEIYQTTKEIAWLCLNKDYRPSSIDKQHLVKILVSRSNIGGEESQAFKERNEEEIKSKLEYLKTNLPVIQIDEETNLVSFRLDPLAEYLAALRLVEYCSEAKGEEAERWQEFLDSVGQKKSPRITIQGFLLAVWDTCWYCQKHLEASIPSNVPDAIIAKADLKEEEFRLAKQTRQIQQLITNLQEWSEPNLIKGLVEQLGEFGEASKSAVPYLIEKLLVEELRPSVGTTLVKIGSKTIPGLLQNLEKGRVDIRRSIAKILGSFESGVEEIIPGLIAALRDDDLEVKRAAIFSMGKMGKKAEITVSNLISLVKDVNENRELRRCAAKALGAIGSDREDVVNALQRITENTAEASDIRLAAIQALCWMGNSIPPSSVATIHGNELSVQPINTSIETKFERLDEDVVLEMVLMPSGSFMMGSPASEEGHDENEEPQREVKIRQFFMSKHPITQAQWQVVSNYPKVERELPSNPSKFFGDANCPVEMVSWLDAVEFCERLSRHTNQEYRLPSEAEWEYACRAGTLTPFHFGETITTDLANYCGMANRNQKLREKYKGFYGQGSVGDYCESTTPIGKFGVANAFGLCDVHGNVWEMCADPWHDNYTDAPNSGDPWNDEDAKKDYRVMRGGAWNSDPKLCRSACRNLIGLEARDHAIGFRVCFSRLLS